MFTPFLFKSTIKMTITLNTTTDPTTGNTLCSSLTISSTLLDDWVANQGTKTLTVAFRSHCDATLYSKVIEIADISGDGAATPYSFNLVPADYETTNILPQGVHTIKLTLTVTSTSSKTNETGCKIVACDLECQVRDFQAANLDSNIWMWYNALTIGESCDQCSCEESCSIWDHIQEMLNNTVTNDCGCN